MSSKRPTILIATSYTVKTKPHQEEITLPAGYLASVLAAGGLPLLVPPMDGPGSAAAWRRLVRTGDALLLVGGLDVDPRAYGQKPHPETVVSAALRQEADLRLLGWSDRRRVPTLAVCLGIQTMVVHRGGTLIQHLPQVDPKLRRHMQPAGRKLPRHMVRIDPGSRLARIVGRQTLSVNSSHHQAVDRPGRHLQPVAWSGDGLIEAVEDQRADRFFLGLQWHPESLHREPRHLALFKALVRQAVRCRGGTG
ncbi:MAG: gamma-glutamyl-gamma-aminobutyrate hydrolase family protein [Anaerolineaceae bacterium]|nr:gamma-glutamyl-gamma-aminobutyrate hydrolase family protein [Anaerolineaceae bacterium]